MAKHGTITWWRLVNWKIVTGIGVTSWAALGSAVWYSMPNAPMPQAHVVAPPRAVPSPPPAIEPPEVPIVVTPPTPEPPRVHTQPCFASTIWFHAGTFAMLPHTQPSLSPNHPFLPDPDVLLAKVVEAQVRHAQQLLNEAKLANLPVNAEVAAAFAPSTKPKKADTTVPPQTINGCKTFETFVAFQPSPLEATRKAKLTGKLVLALHLSGNIEDDGFT